MKETGRDGQLYDKEVSDRIYKGRGISENSGDINGELESLNLEENYVEETTL